MLKQKTEENSNSRIEKLRNKYKSKYSCNKKFISFIEKLTKLYTNFYNELESIVSKNSLAKDFQESSIHPLLLNLENHLKFQANELSKLSFFINKEICEALKTMVSSNDILEDKLYKEMIELNKTLKRSKTKLKDNQNSYNSKMKNLEKSIADEKSNSDVKDKKKIIMDLISDCKVEENKYEKSIEEFNNNLENVRQKEQIIIGFYKNFEEKIIKKINDNVKIIFASFKELSMKINNNIEDTLKIMINVDFGKDLTEFDKFVEENYKAEKYAKFIPYKPNASLDDSLKVKNDQSDKKDYSINYEIISIFQNYFKNTYKKVDLPEEKRRCELRNLCIRLFDKDQNIKFTNDDLNNLLTFMEKVDYRDYFLSYLTIERTNGILYRSEKLINELSIILKQILYLAEQEKNFNNAKNCIILGQTFYMEKSIIKENVITETKKIYIMEFFKNNSWIHTLDFWYNLIEMQIINDKEKLSKEHPNMDKSLMENKLKNIYFSSILTFTHNMEVFGMEKKQTLELCKNLTERYKLSDDLKNILIKSVEDSYDPEKKKIKEKQEIENKRNSNKSKKKNMEDDWVVYNKDTQTKENKNDQPETDIMVDDFVVTGNDNEIKNINNNDININNNENNIINNNSIKEDFKKDENKEKKDKNKENIKEDKTGNKDNNE